MSLPLDCFGEICQFFFSQPNEFFSVYSLCKSIQWYFDNEFPEVTRGILFILQDPTILKKEKKYVTRLHIGWGGEGDNPQKIDPTLIHFPNLYDLSYNFEGIKTSFFESIAKLKKLERFFGLVSGEQSVDNDHLTFFKNLRVVNIESGFRHDDSGDYSDAGLRHLTNVEILNVSYYGNNFTGSCLEHLKKLRHLRADSCHNLKGENFRFLSNLRKLSVISVGGLLDKHLQYLKSIESLNVENAGKFTDAGFELLPVTLKELYYGGSANKQITREGVKRFKNLESLSYYPFRGFGGELKNFLKLKKLRINLGNEELLEKDGALKWAEENLEEIQIIIKGSSFSSYKLLMHKEVARICAMKNLKKLRTIDISEEISFMSVNSHDLEMDLIFGKISESEDAMKRIEVVGGDFKF